MDVKDHYEDAIEQARLFVRLGNEKKAEAIMDQAKRMKDEELNLFYLGIIREHMETLFEKYDGKISAMKDDHLLVSCQTIARVTGLADRANEIVLEMKKAWKTSKK